MTIPVIGMMFFKEILSILITETILPVNLSVDNKQENTISLRELMSDMLTHRFDHIKQAT